MKTEIEVKHLFETHKAEIEAIMHENRCFQGHGCYMSGLTKLCKASSYGTGDLLVCQEEFPLACPRTKSFGSKYMCNCKLRKYIHSTLEI